MSTRAKTVERGAGDVPSMVLGADNVINLCSDEEPDDALTVPAAQAAPAAHTVPAVGLRIVHLSQQRPPRATSKPDHFMHQPTANGTGGRRPAKRKQAAARTAGSKASSSSKAGSRSATSSSSAANSSSGHRGEVDVHEILNTYIEVWWEADRKWYAGRVAKYEDGGCHRVEYDDGDVKRENLRGGAQAQWQGKAIEAVKWRKQGQPAAREPQAQPESQSEAESEQVVESEQEVDLPSGPSQQRQRGSTSEPHAAAQSAFGAGSCGPLRFNADRVQYLPLLVRRRACPPLLCNSTLQ